MTRRCFFVVIAATVAVAASGCGKQEAGPTGAPPAGEGGRAGPARQTEAKTDFTCLDVPAPSFTLPDLKGDEVALEEVLRESHVLLVFWATWCPYCEEEIPALNRLQEEYGEDLTVLAIDYKESREKVTSYADEQGMDYRILLDGDGSVFERYGVAATPTLILVRQSGEICYRGRHVEEVRAALKGLLGRTGRGLE